jgi:glycosyltransferase involved in cell wall biosynthesis
LVSILTPSFNQGKWLVDNLRSVASQTYPNIEHIVMDGGSTDETLTVLKGHVGSLRWRSEPDRGQSHAINKAFSESRGEIIGWLNSDDAYFDSEAVSAAVRVFEERPEVVVVYGHAVLVNGVGLILQAIWTPPYSYRLLRFGNFIIQPAAFIRRQSLGFHLVDESYKSAMDREVWLRLGQHGPFARVPKVLAIDRHHLGRKTMTRPDLAQMDKVRLVDRYALTKESHHVTARKLQKIIWRFIALGLLASIGNSKPVFQAANDGLLRLAVRQVAVRRANMPGVGVVSTSHRNMGMEP